MACANKDLYSKFKEKDRVVIKDPNTFLGGQRGTIARKEGTYLYLNLDSGITVVVYHKRCNRLVKKKRSI
mgnify:CR=1 FL=1